MGHCDPLTKHTKKEVPETPAPKAIQAKGVFSLHGSSAAIIRIVAARLSHLLSNIYNPSRLICLRRGLALTLPSSLA